MSDATSFKVTAVYCSCFESCDRKWVVDGEQVVPADQLVSVPRYKCGELSYVETFFLDCAVKEFGAERVAQMQAREKEGF